MSTKSNSNNKKLIKACVQSLAKHESATDVDADDALASEQEGLKAVTKEDYLREASEKGTIVC